MNILKLITETRTYRRFHQDKPISQEQLRELTELARLSGSARNLQPLKFMLVNDADTNSIIFPCLGWAGYLTDWPGPEEGERPSAYIICLLDLNICDEADFDLGIATQNILLGAASMGLGGCRIGSFSGKLSTLLKLPQHLKLMMVLALGVPKEIVKITQTPQDGSIQYWHDQDGVHHVPKRKLSEIIV